MLMFFLTVIAGIIALSFVSSIILGIIALRKKDKESKEYRKRVDNAMKELRENTKKGA